MSRKLNWKSLHFGKLTRDSINKAVKDTKWQGIRKSMIGIPLQEKHSTLKGWLKENNYSEKSKVQVTNYINALKRGGLVE